MMEWGIRQTPGAEDASTPGDIATAPIQRISFVGHEGTSKLRLLEPGWDAGSNCWVMIGTVHVIWDAQSGEAAAINLEWSFRRAGIIMHHGARMGRHMS